LKDYIEERCLKIAEYIVTHKTTIRQCAKVFKVSKSTIHKDLSERLSRINSELEEEVKNLLEYNKSVRHLRGGMATRNKYKQ
jgi:putative DeoR family transcriptional regulator (stage III sporulation protein D)